MPCVELDSDTSTAARFGFASQRTVSSVCRMTIGAQAVVTGPTSNRQLKVKKGNLAPTYFRAGPIFARETHPACPAYPGIQLCGRLGAGRNI